MKNINIFLNKIFNENKDWQLKVIPQGRTNKNYLFSYQGHKYVLRVNNHQMHDESARKREYDLINRLEKASFMPKVVHKSTDYMITQFIDETHSKIDNDYLIKTINSLKQLEKMGSLADNDFDFKDRINYYESIRAKYNHPTQPDQDKWLALAWKLHEKYINEPKVVCHSDLSFENIIISNEKAYLIDWEYAGNGNAYYDYAVLIARNSLTEQQIKFICSYANLDRAKLNDFLFICSLLGMYWTYTKPPVWDDIWVHYHELQVSRVANHVKNVSVKL